MLKSIARATNHAMATATRAASTIAPFHLALPVNNLDDGVSILTYIRLRRQLLLLM